MELYIQNRWNNKDDAPRLKKNIVLEHYLLKKKNRIIVIIKNPWLMFHLGVSVFIFSSTKKEIDRRGAQSTFFLFLLFLMK